MMMLHTLFLSVILSVAPAPADSGTGLLLHVSFDVDRKADLAVGNPLPNQSRSGPPNPGEKLVPGKFGQALQGGYGYYDARANFNPRRGTVAFFLRQRNKPYGFEPLVVSTVDYYYWLRYLRLETKPKGVLVTSFANEIYRPRSTGGAQDAIKEDVWQHIAIVWDEAQGFVTYIDGEPYTSMWGQHTWLTHGVDADSFWLRPDADVAYDELYVFDRPLTQAQVRSLMRDNKAPDLPPAEAWDAVQQRHRLEELSWAADDTSLPPAALGKPNLVRQIVPLRARAVKGECNIAFDGKLGNGWPALYGYDYAGGNGLHVDLPEPVDYVMVEGRFAGKVYAGNALIIDDAATALADIRSTQFLHRWKLAAPHAAGWMSFFRYTPENLADAPDKEQLLTGRINELGFFQLSSNLTPDPATKTHRWYLGQMTPAIDMARFPVGDRNTFALTDAAPASPAGQTLPALRYHHIRIPAADVDRPLAAFRLSLQLQGSSPDNAVRVELNDPLLPSRRLMAFDYALAESTGTLDMTFDLADRIVPVGMPLWITLCFKRDVALSSSSADSSSFIEWSETDLQRAIDGYLTADMPLVLARFAELAESRPWGATPVPEEQLPRHYKLTGELFTPLACMHRLRPDHPTVKALWAWTHKDTVDKSSVDVHPVAGAPRWALLQRELRARCRGVFEWWIDNRQVPTGEFGDDLNDDTDFMQDIPRYALVGDADRKLTNAATAVADACVNQGAITQGVSTLPTDPLHAYENGTNILPVAAMLHYGDPLRVEALMEAARTVEERFTALDVHGRRRFRSSYLGYNAIREEGNEGVDTFGNALMAHPALFLAYYSRNPRATKFVTDYADGWIAYWNESDKIDPKKIPAATRLDGTVTRWDHRVRGWGFSSLFVGALRLTGDERYRQAAFRWINPQAGQFRSGDNIATLEAVDFGKYAAQLAAWADQAELAHVTVDQFGQVARQRYLKFEAAGDEQAATDALEASLRNIRLLFDAYTLGEPQNDRIWPPEMVASMMALGESPHERNQLYPRHYVSYESFTDLAAWVRRKSDTSLTVWIYSFAPDTQRGTLRVWRTPAGQYTVSIDGQSTTAPLHRGAGITVELPPGKPIEMTIDLLKLDEADFWQRPDAAVSASQLTWKDGALSAVIHNLGNTPLNNLHIALVDAAGKPVATQTVASIEPPLDLMPRTATVTFTSVPADARRLILNPGNTIPELYDLNNTADLPAR